MRMHIFSFSLAQNYQKADLHAPKSESNLVLIFPSLENKHAF